MPSITGIKSRIVFDSRGDKTIEIDVTTDEKFSGRACAPSGASVGKHEAKSFPQNSPERALEVLKANSMKFIGLDAENLKTISDSLRSIDDTETYSVIGAAVAYALSLASIESASKALGRPMFVLLKSDKPYRFPFPLGNILGGGAHAGPGTPDIQEILACPIGARNVRESLEMNFRVHKEVRKVIQTNDKDFTYGRGDEGGWAPKASNEQALEITEQAVKDCGFKVGDDMSLGIDFASSSFWDAKAQMYNYRRQKITRDRYKQIDYVNQLIKDYKLVYVEDPVNEEDFEGAAIITKDNNKCIVTGDDMLVTNIARAKNAAELKACSGAILKVNQAGSLYDAMNFAQECTANDIKLITSHRSGESIDAHLTHIGIATDSRMLKAGIVGGERIAKLNELLRLTEYDLIDGMAVL